MDTRSFEKMRSAINSIPYARFSNEVAVQTEQSFLKDLKIQGNSLDTALDSSKKTELLNKRRPKILRDANKNEYISFFGSDNGYNVVDSNTKQNFHKYFLPTIIISRSRKLKSNKNVKNIRKVSFIMSEKNSSDHSIKSQDSTPSKTGAKTSSIVEVRLPTSDESSAEPSELERTKIQTIIHTNTPKDNFCSTISKNSVNECKHSVSQKGKRNLPLKSESLKRYSAPPAEKFIRHENKRYSGSDNTLQPDSNFSFRPVTQQRNVGLKEVPPKPQRNHAYTCQQKIFTPEIQKRTTSISSKDSLVEKIKKKEIPSRERLTEKTHQERINLSGLDEKSIIDAHYYSMLIHERTTPSFRKNLNSREDEVIRKLKLEMKNKQLSRSFVHQISSEKCNDSFRGINKPKAKSSSYMDFKDEDKEKENCLSQSAVKYDRAKQETKHYRQSQIRHCSLNFPNRNNFISDFYTKQIYTSTTPKSSSQLRYYLRQTQSVHHRCECNSLSKQYGASHCSAKRTTMSGINDGGIQGKGVFKETIVQQMVKETMRERLRQHGTGCRFGPRNRNNLPWFIQEDVACGEQVHIRVLPGLYVGNFRDSKDQEQLNKHNISHILAIHDNARKLPCNNDKEYLCIIASDSPGQNLTQFFPVCNDFIHTARLKGGNILIHCLAGMSRSVTVAVVYVMCVTSLSWRDALKAVQGARNVANPNVGFLKQLQEFEKDRLQDERRRIREKFPNGNLTEEDELMAKELVSSYYHYMSTGEMCDGNCHQGVVCPRGLCNQSRSIGIFRRNSRETSANSRSSSPLRRQTSSPINNMIDNPRVSPEHSRNPSPLSSPCSQRCSTSTLTPPVSPYYPRRSLNNYTEPINPQAVSPESPSRSRKLCGSYYGQPTPPGSPSRSFGYYTGSSINSPLASPSGSLKNNNYGSGGFQISQPRSYLQGKIIHCPSTPPSSPARSCRNKNHLSQMTPPTSPSLRTRISGDSRKFIKSDLNASTSSLNTKEQTRRKSTKSTLKANLLASSPHKKLTRLCQRETKSLDLSSPPDSPIRDTVVKKDLLYQQSVPNSPLKRRTKLGLDHSSSPSRFCQAVTRLLPQIAVLNSSSRLCKNISKPFGKRETSLYVDEKGRSTLRPNKYDESLSSSTDSSRDLNAMELDADFDSSMVMFELCKSIQKLPKDCEIYYEPTTRTVESDLIPERKASLHTTIDISSYKNNSTTNIIINPIFSLENKYEAESLCNNQTMKDDKKNSYSAFLEDDMIYVETTEFKISDIKPSKGRSLSLSCQGTSQEKITDSETSFGSIPYSHDYNSQKIKFKTLEKDRGFSSSLVQTKLERDLTISKRNESSFKGYVEFGSKAFFSPPAYKCKDIASAATFTEAMFPKNELNEDRYKIRNGSFSSFKAPPCRPSNGPPPPIPPRKRANPSNGRPTTPPPVPPRNMKPSV